MTSLIRGCDTAAAITKAEAAQLKLNGYEFIARYYRRNLNGKWAISLGEADGIFSVGLYLLSVFQFRDRLEDFNLLAAQEDVESAIEKAREMGQPKGSGIYFACDTNPRPDDGNPATFDVSDVRKYYDCVFADLRRAGYRCGVYGSGLLCELLLVEDPIADLSWMSNAKGWFGYKEHTMWTVLQTTLPKKPWNGASFEVDDDVCAMPLAAAGMWRP